MLAATPVITGFALAAGSDSGVSAAPATLKDDITNVVMPTLTGTVSEAATVNVYVDTNGDGMLEVGTDQLLGTTTVTATAGGTWSIPSTVSLNEAAVSTTIDGPRTLFAQAVAGDNDRHRRDAAHRPRHGRPPGIERDGQRAGRFPADSDRPHCRDDRLGHHVHRQHGGGERDGPAHLRGDQ